MSNHITSRSNIVKTQAGNFICFDRRNNLRRAPRKLRSATAIYEPNRFSRRNGIERRDTMVVYCEHKQAS